MSFEFSNFDMIVDFSRMTYTDHLIAIVECGKNSPHFNAHLEKVLNWSLTNNIINSVADTMFNYYGASERRNINNKEYCSQISKSYKYYQYFISYREKIVSPCAVDPI